MRIRWINSCFVLGTYLLCAQAAGSPQQIAQAALVSSVPSGTIVLSETKEARIGYTDTGMVTTVHIGLESWTTKTPAPTGRRGLAVAEVDGKIYAIIGGYDNALPYSAVCEEYDQQTDSWATKAPMPTAREGAAAASVAGKIYVIGGWDGVSYLSTVE